MKKIILMAVAMLSMTTATFAAENENEAVAATYSMNINLGALAGALDMNIDQVEAAEDINKSFSADLMNAGSVSNAEERQDLVKKSIDKNLKYMHYILSNDQYRKYVMLLNTTLNNRGLNK